MSDPESSEPAFPERRHVVETGCARCPALASDRERISWGTGPGDADVIVVGEAPGYGNPEAERWRGGNWTGKAYTSRHSGRRIRRLLADVGYPDAYYTNAVKCFPASEEPRSSTEREESGSSEATGGAANEGEPPTNREPTPEERERCRDHLLAEIDSVSPAVVLATGKHATTSVLAAEGRKLDSFLDTVLESIPCEQLDTCLLPILHPSYQDIWIARLGYEPEEYRAAVGEALDELCGPMA